MKYFGRPIAEEVEGDILPPDSSDSPDNTWTESGVDEK